MKKKIFSILLALVLAVSMSLVTAVPAAANTINVPGDHLTIQEAINAAGDEDTIIVNDGTYTENVEVTKRLTIKSVNGPASTIVEAANANDHVFEIGADHVNISGFTVKNATGSSGITVWGTQANISDVWSLNNKIGIQLCADSNSNTLTGNTISGNYGGITLYRSSHNTLTGNTVDSSDSTAIFVFSGSHYNVLTNNIVTNSGSGIFLEDWSSNNTISGNTILNNHYAGIHLHNSCSVNIIESNTITGNTNYGICIDYCDGNIVNENTISNNVWWGVSIDHANNNAITGNTIVDNGWGGISLRWSSSYNIISDNDVRNTGLEIDWEGRPKRYYGGITIFDYPYGSCISQGNVVYHNDFINNEPQQAWDGGTANRWDDGYPSGGNYWSDYAGVDEMRGPGQDQSGGDGIGDAPYGILGPAENKDHYPFWSESGWVNQPPVADAGGPYDGDEGSPITFDASTSSDPDGDPLQYRWDFDNDQIWDTDWLDVPMASCTWGDDYSGTVTVEVSDGQLTDTATADVIVNNVAPTVGEITAPVDPVQANTEIYTSADFTDSGVLDTHTAVWDWGDDSTSPGTVTEIDGSGSMSGSHTYTAAGVYTVTPTVTDDDGGSGQSFFQYVVVYDPEGGFVTGGGWIDSPEGAYTDDPSLTGKATFGFVSKYKKGAEYPSGETQFRFRVADLNFHSTSYEWLVVAEAKAKFKGKGTINGSGEYKFLLTAIDANINDSDTFDVDRFRIKIWCEDGNTEAVKYDNVLGDDNATTEIGGGSIVIHKK